MLCVPGGKLAEVIFLKEDSLSATEITGNVNTCRALARDMCFNTSFTEFFIKNRAVFLGFGEADTIKQGLKSEAINIVAYAFENNNLGLEKGRQFRFVVVCMVSFPIKNCKQLLSQPFWRLTAQAHSNISPLGDIEAVVARRRKLLQLYVSSFRSVFGCIILILKIVINMSFIFFC